MYTILKKALRAYGSHLTLFLLAWDSHIGMVPLTLTWNVDDMGKKWSIPSTDM